MRSGKGWGQLGMTFKWRECQLGDLVTFQRGHDLPKTQMAIGEYPVVGSNGIIGYHNEYTTEAPSITIGRSGNVGKPFLYNGRTWSHNTSLYIKEYKNVNPFFIYYFLQTLDLHNYAGGSAVPTLNRNHIHTLNVCVPDDIDVQREIATILYGIDQKITINTAINENLEQQIKALCEKWVSEHSKSIMMLPLAEIAEINSDTYSPKQNWEYVNYLDTSSITNGVIFEIQTIRPNEEKLPSRARRIIKAGDIVYSTVRPNQLHFGIISVPLKNMLASTGFVVIRSKYSYISSPYIYHFLTSPDFIEKMQQLAEQSTSTFPSVKPSDIGTCLIPCADSEKMQSITETINDIYEMVSANHQENQCLATLRDTLLPKLMNGEIDVSNVQI